MNIQVFFNFYQDIFKNNLLIFLLLYLLIYFINILLVFIIFADNNINSNNIIKILKKNSVRSDFKNYLVLSFSSLIGIPPLSGFISKFFLNYFVFLKYNIFILSVFFILVLFSMFFYLQVLKLIKKNEVKASDLKTNKQLLPIWTKNNKFNKFFILNLLSLFITFLLFIFKDIILILFLFK